MISADLLQQATERADRAAARSAELHDRLEQLRRPGFAAAPGVPMGHRGRRAPPAGAAAESAQRWVAQLEQTVAAAHERAAELYESWLRDHIGGPARNLEQRARKHRKIAAAARSIPRLAEQTVRGFEVRVKAATPGRGKGEHLAVLAGLERLRELVDRRVEATVGRCRRDRATWAEIATALRVTRQTAHERYRTPSKATPRRSWQPRPVRDS